MARDAADAVNSAVAEDEEGGQHRLPSPWPACGTDLALNSGPKI